MQQLGLDLGDEEEHVVPLPPVATWRLRLEHSCRLPRHAFILAQGVIRSTCRRACGSWWLDHREHDADAATPAQGSGSGSSADPAAAKHALPELGGVEHGDSGRQWKVIAFVSSAAMFCLYTRSVLSIVIPHVAAELNLTDPTTALSSFFYGYVVTNAASSMVLQRYHPKRLLLCSVLFSSLSTVILPLAIQVAGYQGLVACRIVAGFTQGFLFPSLYGLLGAELAADPVAKTRALAVLGGVSQLGIAANFLGSPWLVSYGGWQLAVQVAGCIGLPWCLIWASSSVFQTSPEQKKQDRDSLQAVPYGEIFAAKPFRAVLCGHFAHNWAGTVVMAWLPTYLRQELHVGGESLGIACLPYVAMALASPMAGLLASQMLKSRWDVWLVRRIMATGGLLGPALGLLIFPRIPEEWWPLPMVCVALVMAFMTWASSSVLATPLDLAGPRLSGALFSITNSVCAVPCFLGIEVIGTVQEKYGWATAWGVCSVLYVAAFFAYQCFGSARRMFD